MKEQARNLMRQFYRAIPFKRPIFEILRKAATLPPGLYQHLHFEGPFEIAIDARHSFRMTGYGDALENELFWGGFGGSWEQMSLRLWLTLCRASEQTIIDVGANTGVYSLAAAAVDPGANIIAFEPIARIADRIADNARQNGFPIHIIRTAVSDQVGTLPIFDTTESVNYSASLENSLENTISYPVEVTTLDGFLANRGRSQLPVHAIKIDVETHEPAVIRGFLETLERDRPAILIEILNEQIGDDIAQLVSRFGYRWFHVHEEEGLIETDRLRPVGSRNWNHLLCPQDKFEAAGLTNLLATRES